MAERLDIKFSFNGKNYEWAADMENLNTARYEGELPYFAEKSRLNKSRGHDERDYEIDTQDNKWYIEMPSFDGDKYHFQIFFNIKLKKFKDEDGDMVTRYIYTSDWLPEVNVWNDTDEDIMVAGEELHYDTFEVFKVSEYKKITKTKKISLTKIQEKEAEKTMPDTFREYRDAIIYCDKRGYEHEAGAISPDGTVLNWEIGRYQTKLEFERYCRTRYND